MQSQKSVAHSEASLVVCRLLNLVGECDGEIRAGNVGTPVGVADEDVGAEAEGAVLRTRVVRTEPERVG
jgi:hypothetical protein